MAKRLLAILLLAVIAASGGIVCAEENAENLTVFRCDDFEDYETGTLCEGSKVYPLEGENAGTGVKRSDGGNFKNVNAEGKGGFALSLNSGINGSMVKTKGADGRDTNAIQIMRTKGASVSSAKLSLNPFSDISTAHLKYSIDIRNGGKCGNPGEPGYTKAVNNYFGSLTLLGITLNFSDKSIKFGGSMTSNPPVSDKLIERVLPDNGEWFTFIVDIDALSGKAAVYINGRKAGEQTYGGRYKKISGAELSVSMGESKTDENAVYLDNIKIEKSSMTADELERYYADELFKPLGENAFVMYPGSPKVYFGDSVGYFSEDGSLAPLMSDGKIYAPIRYVAEKYGYTVSWENESAVLKGEKNIEIHIGSLAYTVNGENTLGSAAPIIENNATYVEINDIAMLFDKTAKTDESGLSVIVKGPENVKGLDKLVELYPEASLGFEVEGGWYTQADLTKAANCSVEDLAVTWGVGGRVNQGTSYEMQRYGGIERSTEHVKSGKYSGKWANHHYYPTLMSNGVPTDWTQYNTLSFWVWSDVATGERITVGAVSNPHENYSDYSMGESTVNFLYTQFLVDFTGWKHIEMPLADFKKSTEQTIGFGKVDGLYFYTRAFDYEPYPQTVLYLDDIRLEVLNEEQQKEATVNYRASLDEKDEKLAEPKDYVLDVPDLFRDVSLVDYGYILEYKKAIQNGDTSVQPKLDVIYKQYGIKNDTYKYSDLVVTDKIDIGKEELSMDKVNWNHKFPEVLNQPKNGRIEMQAYFKEARAMYGYNPKFLPEVTTSHNGFRFMFYGNRAIEYADYEGNWHFYDLSAQIDRFCRETLKLDKYTVRDGGFYDETKMRFDKDGDAYAVIMVQGTTTEGGSMITSILAHSRDNLKSWKFYRLPRPFAKMEILDTHNKDCLNDPPVIMFHNYWSNNDDQTGSFVIPEKQSDGTLVIPQETLYCDKPVICTSQHSGKANFCVTIGNKVFFVYGVCWSEDRSEEKKQLAYSAMPKGHPMQALLDGELSKYTKIPGVPTYIVEYDKTEKTISDPVFLGYAGSEYWDAHNWASIAVDSEGKLNVFLIGHHFPLLYTKSKNPADISEWEPIEAISSGISYASMNIDKNDTIYAVTRNSNDGYIFNICLQKKEKGGQWEESKIVQYWKQYYMVWNDDIYMDPEDGALFVTFRSKASWMELYADEWAAKDFIFPEQSQRLTDVSPVGTAKVPVRQYANAGSTIRGEHTGVVSYDGGNTWKLVTTEDYIPKKK